MDIDVRPVTNTVGGLPDRLCDDHAVIGEGSRVQVLEIRGATAMVVEVPQLERG